MGDILSRSDELSMVEVMWLIEEDMDEIWFIEELIDDVTNAILSESQYLEQT